MMLMVFGELGFLTQILHILFDKQLWFFEIQIARNLMIRVKLNDVDSFWKIQRLL